MDSIVAAALIGTGQRPLADTPTTPEVDALVAGMPRAQAEQTLLLRAAAWAIYRLAGATAETGIEPPSPAPTEGMPPCSPAGAELIARMLAGQHSELLPEACERMRRAGLRLPHHLLPPALAIRDKDMREALVPLLGERGRWLASFNTPWSWAANALAGATLPPDAETIWQEGTTEQRVEVLRRLRAVDPAQAREWVAAVWTREKAEVRADLLATLEVNRMLEDGPLLESALDDRAGRVRATAQQLLRHLPGSALATRMRSRAEAALVYADGTLDAHPLFPSKQSKEWTTQCERDGLNMASPAARSAERDLYLRQVLRSVPPDHWEQFFGASPAHLIAATADSSWQSTILESWTNSAARFGVQSWAVPLFEYWRDADEREVQHAKSSRETLMEEIMPLLPAEYRAAWAIDVLGTQRPHQELSELLDALPSPWSHEVGIAYLRGLHTFVAGLTEAARDALPWSATLATAARALPSSCFSAALDPIDLSKFTKNWWLNDFRRQVDSFADVVRTRQRLYEEIPL